MREGKMVAALVVALLIGSGLGWWINGKRLERDRACLVVLHAVGVADLCAGVLGATEAGKVSTAQKVLEDRMASAVNEAAERVGSASQPDIAIPNLIEGLKRARQYAVAKGMPEVVGKCDRVLEFLTKGNVRA